MRSQGQGGAAIKVLYISGPFSHPDPVHGIPKNILQASEAALLAWLISSGQEVFVRWFTNDLIYLKG
jgi:hypothetical protein